MRLLMIAPEQPGINSIPEIRLITRTHHVSLLNGPVSKKDVYEACRASDFQGIHIASHGTPDCIVLSGQETLSNEDVAQLGRMCGAQFIFSNTCMSSHTASYLVGHGIQYVIYTNDNVKDAEAWKMPAAFYDVLQNGHGKDVIGAFRVADSGEGNYGLTVAPALLDEAMHALVACAERRADKDAIPLTPAQFAIIFMALTVTVTLLDQLITYLAGGFK